MRFEPELELKLGLELGLDPDPELAHLDAAPKGNGFGEAMSSSPRERLRNGDVDVATPFHAAKCRDAPPFGSSGEVGFGLLLLVR